MASQASRAAAHEGLQPEDVSPPAQPLRLGTGDVRVGTCSWTDKTLLDGSDWYPKKTMTAEERLRFYAARFPIVEADSTYYRSPSPQLTEGWAERTPDGFCFDVKAYGLLTGHPVERVTLWPDIAAAIRPEHAEKRRTYPGHLDSDALDEVWLRFAHGVEPLRKAGKLGTVLFQFPPWFTPKRANRAELEQLRERLGGLPACVEFRAPAWLGPDDIERTLGLCRDAGLTLVVIDAPPVSGLPSVVAATTEELSVIRFHGRADDTWSARTATAAERFRYLYDRSELQDWVPKVRHLAEETAEVHVLMNTCDRDFGVRNAADMASLLSEGS